MSIIFIYQKNKYKMDNRNNNKINEAFRKFSSLVDKNEKDLIFLYKGKKINNNTLLLNKLNNIIISVFNIRMNKRNKKYDYIRCPTCQNLSHLNINKNKYNISLNNCINNHEFKDLSINQFIKYQNKIIKIKCDICKNNKNLYDNNFYICSCGKNLCKLCLEKHNIKDHNIIEYNRRYDTCIKHGKEYIIYCKDCKLNL